MPAILEYAGASTRATLAKECHKKKCKNSPAVRPSVGNAKLEVNMRGKGAVLVGICTLLFAFGASGQKKEASTRGQEKWRVGEPVVYENLSVFPLLARGSADTGGFLTLDEGLTSGEVVVTETGGDMLRRTRGSDPSVGIQAQVQVAQVNQLVLINRSKKPLLLLAGEVVTGGKQDRIIAKDRIVSPGSEPLPLDVFCVEHGRWTGVSSQFKAANMMVHPSVREKAVVDQSQSDVWVTVTAGSSQRASAGSAAPRAITPEVISGVIAREAQSQSYLKIMQSARVGGQVDSFADEVARRFARAVESLKEEQVVGVVVAYGGEVAWADAFASPVLFNRYWPKLLRSYAVEALARPQGREHASLQDATEFARPLIGHETVESEPGVYRWREVVQGRLVEVYLDSLSGEALTLHWCKVLRTI
jgi:hypothetical protein